jgi:hypothetical protein
MSRKTNLEILPLHEIRLSSRDLAIFFLQVCDAQLVLANVELQTLLKHGVK